MVDNIKIGDQYWSNVNLNSNEFRNGEKIELVKDPKDWFELNKNYKPACCYYNFNESNGQKLGLLKEITLVSNVVSNYLYENLNP